jgi:hypothetical protein
MNSDFIITADNTEGLNQYFSSPPVTIHSNFHGLNHICYSFQNFHVVLFQLARYFLWAVSVNEAFSPCMQLSPVSHHIGSLPQITMVSVTEVPSMLL